VDELVTLSVRISDVAGNETTRSTKLYASKEREKPPQAVFLAKHVPDHAAPHQMECDAAGSTDDGRLLRFEWYLKDGSTAVGHRVTHSFTSAGAHKVILLVRDNDGGIGVAVEQVVVP
jgi:hypothetical protein